MEEYIKWLENKIEVCLEDKDLQREHWAFCQSLKKYREFTFKLKCERCGTFKENPNGLCTECGRSPSPNNYS